MAMISPKSAMENQSVCIVVLGASGDLAKKKTYPALFGLYRNQFLPKDFQIVGYARSDISLKEFRERISSKIKLTPQTSTAPSTPCPMTDEERKRLDLSRQEQERIAKEQLNHFLDRCHYVSGNYDSAVDYDKLRQFVESVEYWGASNGPRNRVFYMALPPSVFIPASKGLREHVYSSAGWNRLIVEKPFGKDFDSSKELSVALGSFWKEEEVYRIDHYLGKEMVKNLFILRFANVFMGAIWNRHYIDNIQITFKEPFGTEGRGGYFDEFGIIRDVMQNHLLQILSIVAMEKPVSLDAEDVRDEKVKVLRQIAPLTMDNVMLGQYVGTPDGSKPGYLDDATVPKGSLTSTFAAAVFRIQNDRWSDVPFILRCGKALNEQKTEVRIQFRDVPGNIFKHELSRNELVIRVQPEEAVYMKLMNKTPGLGMDPHISELDLSYSKRYAEKRIPDAYEALILDVLRGDQSNFVRADELDAAWKIFTPLLHHIERERIEPHNYVYGSRGPAKLDEWIRKHGYSRGALEYHWTPHHGPVTSAPGSPNKL